MPQQSGGGLAPADVTRERQMQRFEAARHAQRFLSTHTRIHNHLQHRRRRLNATDSGIARDVAFRAWREVTDGRRCVTPPKAAPALTFPPPT